MIETHSNFALMIILQSACDKFIIRHEPDEQIYTWTEFNEFYSINLSHLTAFAADECVPMNL